MEKARLRPQVPLYWRMALGFASPSLELWFLLPACPCRANVIDEEALGKWLCWSWENLSWPAGQADLGSFPVLSLCDLGQVA